MLHIISRVEHKLLFMSCSLLLTACFTHAHFIKARCNGQVTECQTVGVGYDGGHELT